MRYLLYLACGAAAAYQIVAILAALRHRLTPAPPPPPEYPPVSILKPVYGRDPHFYRAIRTHAEQAYPNVEILFGAHSLDDPAVPEIRRLIAEFPHRDIRLIVSTRETLNAKVGTLIDLAREARHQILLVNDADIEVPPGYLKDVVAALLQPGTGLATCLYAAVGDTLPAKWEALGITADFAPSVLVAPFVGVREFGLGSTLCFHRKHLDAIGGFEALADYIADDYQLAKRITSQGLAARLAKPAVLTHIAGTWTNVWRHQLRWARTIRVSRGDGYAGLPVTHAGLWALIALLAGQPVIAAALAAVRIASGLATGVLILRRFWLLAVAPLIPLWDLWAFVIWIAGLAGNEIDWRGERLTVTPSGQLRAQ